MTGGSFVVNGTGWKGGENSRVYTCPVQGPIRTKIDRQTGAFQIPGALPFSFKVVDAAWTIRRLKPLQYAGF